MRAQGKTISYKKTLWKKYQGRRNRVLPQLESFAVYVLALFQTIIKYLLNLFNSYANFELKITMFSNVVCMCLCNGN